MSEFIFRTEDIKPEEILGLYVETAKDKRVVDLLKTANPVILEGSRGTGKSFLLRVAEAQLFTSFQTERVLPVYLSFVKSSLLQTRRSATVPAMDDGEALQQDAPNSSSDRFDNPESAGAIDIERWKGSTFYGRDAN